MYPDGVYIMQIWTPYKLNYSRIPSVTIQSIGYFSERKATRVSRSVVVGCYSVKQERNYNLEVVVELQIQLRNRLKHAKAGKIR